jgi:orotidine-5'-phosphate decarboxylase
LAKHFAERLLGAIEEKQTPVCVGLDPIYTQLPKQIREIAAHSKSGLPEHAAAVNEFCQVVIDIVAPHVPAVKLQMAYFELCGPAGLEAYHRVADYAREQGLVVIGDIKRADIGSTSEALASAYLDEVYFTDAAGQEKAVSVDAVTVNPWFGIDGVKPFIETAKANGQGVFVVIRTSNPSAKEIQDIADAEGRKVYEHLAMLCNTWANLPGCVGESGYSLVGAVVGATYPQEAEALRQVMPNSLFLVPGYGAQGANADNCAAAFHSDGWGAIVNSSRGIIYAWTRPGYEEFSEENWEEAVEAATRSMKVDLSQALARKVAAAT